MAIPLFRGLFQLDPLLAILSLATAATLDAIGNQLYKRTGNPVLFLTVALFSNSFCQLFCAMLMVRSSTWGAAVFSTLLLVTAVYNGYLFRTTPKHPYMAIGTVAVVVIAALLSPSLRHLSIIAVTGPAIVIFAVLVGLFSARFEHQRIESEQLRAAVAAQMLQTQSNRADELAGVLDQFAMWNHDMRNAVAVATGNSKILSRLTPEAMLDAEDLKEVAGSASDVKKSLDLITQGLDEMRRLSRDKAAASSKAESVEVLPIIENAIAGVRSRFQSVGIAVEAPSGGDKRGPLASVSGGATTLHRVVENLLLNACEGNGKFGAGNVNVKLEPAGGFVTLEVRDDGPGFDEALLSRPITGFNSTKAQGTGLGLFTVERLIAASGGALQRENRIEGGAAVTIRLPQVRSS
jgi:signal transduction histidine kinase